MKVIRPTTTTEGMLISSTAVEANPTWSSATTYALNAVVVYGIRLYRSLQASNLNRIPSVVGSVWWVDIGPANRFAMFDDQVNTKTTVTAGNLEVTVASGFIDAVYLANMVGNTVTITVRDGLAGPIVYEQTQNLSGEFVLDWYQYFFYDPLVRRTQAIFTGIPPFGNAHVTVTVDGGGTADTSVGVCAFGRLSTVGKTEYGGSTGIIDYSRKETDDFGEVTFVKRNFSKRMDVKVWVTNDQHNRVQRLLYELRATPVVWIATDDPLLEEAMVVYGFYRDFSNEISYPTVSYCSLQIEGLI